MLRFIVVLFALLGPGATWAATTWYTVELMVFQNLSGDGLYSESWPDDPGQPAVREALRLTTSGELSLDDEVDAAGTELYAFQLLSSSQLQLLDVSNRLKWSEGYRPLLHIAWRQPGFSRSKSRAVYVHSALPNRFRTEGNAGGGLSGDPQLSGTVRLSRGRYLHVETDLVHVRSGSAATGVTTRPYRMQQSRRMRSRELHYIDHPAFGVLVRVTPYEPEELFSDESAAAPTE